MPDPSDRSHPLPPAVTRCLAGAAPHAGSFIVTIYGDVAEPRGGTLWMGTLIAVCARHGISEGLVRTAVSRLVAAGRLSGERQGRRSFYRLTPEARGEFAAAARLIFAAPPPVRGWLFRFDAGDGAPDPRAIGWAGAGSGAGSCAIAPDRPDLPRPAGLLFAAVAIAGGSAEKGAGAGESAGGGMDWSAGKDAGGGGSAGTGRSGDEGAGGSAGKGAGAGGSAGTGGNAGGIRDFAARHWPLDPIAAAYRDFIATFEGVLAVVADGFEPDGATALALRLRAVNAFRRVVLSDPRLPDEALPEDWPAAPARRLFAALYLALAGPADACVGRSFRDAAGALAAATEATAARLRALEAVLAD